MLDDLLRPLKDRVMNPLAGLVGRHASPDVLTIAAFFAGSACAALLWAGFTPFALALWILNRVLDGLDGVVARRTSRMSDSGGYLDIVLDFVVYALVPLSMAFASPTLALPCALYLGAAYVNASTWMYLSALLEKRGRGASATGASTSVAMPAGIFEGTETIILYTLMIVAPGWRYVLLLLGAGLVVAGAALRFFQGIRTLRGMQPVTAASPTAASPQAEPCGGSTVLESMQTSYRTIPGVPAEVSGGAVIARMVDGIGFRYRWATEGLEESDLGYRPSADSRTIGELLEHMYGLVRWMVDITGAARPGDVSKTRGLGDLRTSTILLAHDLRRKFVRMTDQQLRQSTITLSSGETFPFWNLLNGPLEDVLTHIGQLSSWRRLRGKPVAERYSTAPPRTHPAAVLPRHGASPKSSGC